MAKKYNLLYDATIFANSYIKGSSDRSGIFFAAYNILKYFAEDSRFIITLYVHDNLHKIKYFKKDNLLSQFPVRINSKETPIFNIGVHKYNIKATGNFVKKIIYSLKIIKNYLYMIYYHRDNSSLLKSIDIFFSPMRPVITELTYYPNIKHFIVLHDMIPVIFYKDSINLECDRFNIIVKSLNNNTYYLCNSNHTKNDFFKYYGDRLDKKKIIVIHHSTSQNFSPNYDKIKLVAILDKYKIKYINDYKYIFSLCNLEPRKNLMFTVKCFFKFISKHNIQDLYFYLGGSQWNKFIHRLEKEIDNFGKYRNKIAGLGYVDDIDVNILYSNSLFFTFISQYEGFGVPPLEAMQAGTPVITSKSSSLPEVVGDAAIMIDYDSEEQCVKAFEDLYFNEDLRKKFIEKGLERAKLFSWEKTVDKMKEVIIENVA
jgi:glycosyltransferase involved in cell wall biosynthesis